MIGGTSISVHIAVGLCSERRYAGGGRCGQPAGPIRPGLVRPGPARPGPTDRARRLCPAPAGRGGGARRLKDALRGCPTGNPTRRTRSRRQIRARAARGASLTAARPARNRPRPVPGGPLGPSVQPRGGVVPLAGEPLCTSPLLGGLCVHGLHPLSSWGAQEDKGPGGFPGPALRRGLRGPPLGQEGPARMSRSPSEAAADSQRPRSPSEEEGGDRAGQGSAFVLLRRQGLVSPRPRVRTGL